MLAWIMILTGLCRRNGVKSICVLVVDKDFGEFVEVDKSYWSKSVAPFVGERVPIFLL